MNTFENLLFVPRDTRKLTDYEKKYTGKIKKKEAKKSLKARTKELADLQYRLYAENKKSILMIMQAIDAGGKDGTIRHVMSKVNPQGCKVISFKAPSETELDHDYLWRCMKELPAKGNITVFNRSYYEEVLTTRVHPEFLAKQNIPGIEAGKDPGESFWQTRYNDINKFEEYLVNNNIHVLKFFLNLSKEEQKNRFLKRIERSDKNWKFSKSDIEERKYWEEYQNAFEQMLIQTSTGYAPWHVIPADRKWFMRLAIAEILVEKLKSLNSSFPKLNERQKEELEETKQMLINEEKD